MVGPPSDLNVSRRLFMSYFEGGVDTKGRCKTSDLSYCAYCNSFNTSYTFYIGKEKEDRQPKR